MEGKSVLESFRHWLNQDFHFSYLLALSVLIILVFGLFGKWQYRVAWYIAISAPAALFGPYALLRAVAVNGPSRLRDVDDLTPAYAAYLWHCPASWVFPAFLMMQLVKITRREFRPMTGTSDWTVAGLALMYLQCDYFVSTIHP